jgi:hypothetical protein
MIEKIKGFEDIKKHIEVLKIFTLNTKTQVLIRGYGLVKNGKLELLN